MLNIFSVPLRLLPSRICNEIVTVDPSLLKQHFNFHLEKSFKIVFFTKLWKMEKLSSISSLNLRYLYIENCCIFIIQLLFFIILFCFFDFFSLSQNYTVHPNFHSHNYLFAKASVMISFPNWANFCEVKS